MLARSANGIHVAAISFVSAFLSCRVRAAAHHARVAVSWRADDRKNLEGSRDHPRLLSGLSPGQARADAPFGSPVIKGSRAPSRHLRPPFRQGSGMPPCALSFFFFSFHFDFDRGARGQPRAIDEALRTPFGRPCGLPPARAEIVTKSADGRSQRRKRARRLRTFLRIRTSLSNIWGEERARGALVRHL